MNNNPYSPSEVCPGNLSQDRLLTDATIATKTVLMWILVWAISSAFGSWIVLTVDFLPIAFRPKPIADFLVLFIVFFVQGFLVYFIFNFRHYGGIATLFACAISSLFNGVAVGSCVKYSLNLQAVFSVQNSTVILCGLFFGLIFSLLAYKGTVKAISGRKWDDRKKVETQQGSGIVGLRD